MVGCQATAQHAINLHEKNFPIKKKNKNKKQILYPKKVLKKTYVK